MKAVYLSIIGIAALIVFLNIWPPTVGRTVFVTPAQRERHMREEVQRQTDRGMRMKPAVDLAVAGDYEAALAQFEALDRQGEQGLAKDRLLCLLHLGRGEDGLNLLRSLPAQALSVAEEQKIGPALAVIAHDETALENRLTGRVRYDRVVNGGSAAEKAAARSQPVVPGDVHTANLIMKIACEFGEDYDDEMLHRLGQEAIRRGCTDQTLLRDYANWCQLNGNLREGVALCRQLEQSATDPEIRSWAHRQVYDTSNIIVQFTRHHSIEQEERQRHEDYRTHFFRHMW